MKGHLSEAWWVLPMCISPDWPKVYLSFLSFFSPSQSMEKLSSMKPVPSAKKVGDWCSMGLIRVKDVDSQNKSMVPGSPLHLWSKPNQLQPNPWDSSPDKNWGWQVWASPGLENFPKDWISEGTGRICFLFPRVLGSLESKQFWVLPESMGSCSQWTGEVWSHPESPLVW